MTAHVSSGPPEGRRSPLKGDALERARGLVAQLLETRFAGYGGQTRLAKAIGISQPSLSNIRQGGGISRDTAYRIARVAGVDPEALIGSSSVATSASTRYPNLEICVAYHDGEDRWTHATISAARSSLWPSDASPKEWASRLDELEAAMSSVVSKRRS